MTSVRSCPRRECSTSPPGTRHPACCTTYTRVFYTCACIVCRSVRCRAMSTWALLCPMQSKATRYARNLRGVGQRHNSLASWVRAYPCATLCSWCWDTRAHVWWNAKTCETCVALGTGTAQHLGRTAPHSVHIDALGSNAIQSNLVYTSTWCTRALISIALQACSMT